jgi:glutamate 5-kinase
MRDKIRQAKRWVVKVGSSLVTNDGRGLDLAAIETWAEQLVAMRAQGIQVVLVSSGAVAEGVSRLGLSKRPTQVNLQQAAAAVGQMGLIQAYESCFNRHDVRAAQILLTHEDLSDRTRYLNARSTLTTLLDLGVVPVVNENDTVATAEICLGDNDTLAGLVANLINADAMVLLTDQDGLYSADPRFDKSAQLISVGSALDPSLTAMAGGGGSLGRGGMRTKLSAARLAARSGTNTIIANGREAEILGRLSRGEDLGTLLEADSEPVGARKQWLASQLSTQGEVVLDAGAVRVLKEAGKSLLAVGIVGVAGAFNRGEVIVCLDGEGREVARGLSNYSAAEVERLRGKSSERIVELLGYAGDDEIIHRDNLILSET